MSTRPSDADPGLLPTLAALAVGLTGLVHVLLAVQFLAFWLLTTGQWVVVLMIGAMGALALLAAVRVNQGSAMAAVGATALAPAMGLLSTVYIIYAMYHGSFALYMLFAPPSALLATLTAPLAIGPCRRAAKARAELKAKYTSGPLSGVFD